MLCFNFFYKTYARGIFSYYYTICLHTGIVSNTEQRAQVTTLPACLLKRALQNT